MNRINVLNVKTGRVVNMLEKTYRKLLAAGKGKDFDLVGAKPEKSTNEQEGPKDESQEVDSNGDGKISAKEVISAIRKAKTTEEVNNLIEGEDRSSVLKAAQARKAALK